MCCSVLNTCAVSTNRCLKICFAAKLYPPDSLPGIFRNNIHECTQAKRLEELKTSKVGGRGCAGAATDGAGAQAHISTT